MIRLELPTRDFATLVGRLPFTSRRGELRLDLAGVSFVAETGEEVLQIPPLQIRDMRAKGAADLVMVYDDRGRRRRCRFRVRWAPSADRLRATSNYAVVSAAARPGFYGPRGGRRRKSGRDRTVVRDRWISTLELLLNSDRYALGRQA